MFSDLSTPPPLPAGRRTDGSSLAATMMVVAAIVSFLSIAALMTSQNARYAGHQQGTSDQLTAADAALEYAYAQWKATVATYIHGNKSTNIPPPSVWAGSTMMTNFNAAYSNTGAFAANTAMTCTALNIISTDQNGNPLTSAGGADVSATTAPGGVKTSNVDYYPGWSGSVFNYRAAATIATTGRFGRAANDSPVTVYRYFQVTEVPLFQAAIFYENVLEIHPGAFMRVTGLVHSNDSIYALGFLANLQFMSNVSYVGTYNESSNPAVRYGWDGSNSPSDLIPDPYAAYYPDYWADGNPTSTSTTRASQINQVGIIDPFGGFNQNNNGLHDIIEVPTGAEVNDPQVAYNNATLRITIDSSQPLTSSARYLITDGSGTALTGVDRTNIIAALTTTAPSTITDLRETATVTVTSVDMAKLAYATVPTSALNGTNEFTTQSFPTGTNTDGTAYGGTNSAGTTFQKGFSGTVYIHDVAPTGSATRTAIRLVNGRELGQNVSIASDNAVYIQGDYNTGGSASNPVPSDVSASGNPQTSNYSRHASSVMADAVTILSNGWLDSNSNAVLTSRNATATTVNTAILAGDVPSNAGGDGIASGGAHNFPRFLENWNNVNFTYYGSLVEAFHSEKFTGSWQTNNVYHWPNRLWNWDTNFATQVPPGTPVGIQFSRGRWSRAVN